MKKILLILMFIPLISFGQNLNIPTKSISVGYFQSIPSINANSLCKYKKNKQIIITGVGSNDWWFGKTDDCEGWIYAMSININKEMLDALEQDKLRLEKEENKRLEERINAEKLKQIHTQFEKRQSDSIKAVEDEVKRNKIIQKREKVKLKKQDLIDNCHYDRNEIDEFDNIKFMQTEYYFVSPKLLISLSKVGNSKYVYFGLDSDLGCASPYNNDRSYVKVKLENNDILTFYHSGDIDCAEFTLKGKLSNSEILRLKSSPIKTIRLQGTKYYHDEINFDFNDFFIKKLKCIK
jgi:hypothetical protein